MSERFVDPFSMPKPKFPAKIKVTDPDQLDILIRVLTEVIHNGTFNPSGGLPYEEIEKIAPILYHLEEIKETFE